MKKIPLTQGKVAIVDAIDYTYLMQWNWHHGAKGYAVYTDYVSEKPKTILMHQVILQRMGFKFIEVDHRNRVTLDNRRRNLRPATRQNQAHNASKRKDNTSGFKGVTKRRRAGKWTGMWQAQIMVGGRQKFLGLFEDKQEAASAYNKAAKEYFGIFACVNEIQ